jgi:cell division protein FtsI (penicillin-binding protein 3)
VLKPETVAKMRQMMEGVVLEGTGKKAIMAGYTSAGKTGSAQVYDQAANVYTHTYNASFLGFAPVGNPRVVIAVSLHGTKGGSSGFGGVRAAPVFREVALSAMRMLDVPHDLPLLVKNKKSKKVIENDLAAPGPNDASVSVAAARMAQEERPAAVSKTSPGFANDGDVARSNNDAREVLRASNDLAWNREVSRARVVSSVTTPLERGGNPVTSGDPAANQRPFLDGVRPASGATVPDFHGMTKRAVMEESLAAGFPVELHGDGLVSNQEPPPGSSIRPGVAVKVKFGK